MKTQNWIKPLPLGRKWQTEVKLVTSFALCSTSAISLVLSFSNFVTIFPSKSLFLTRSTTGTNFSSCFASSLSFVTVMPPLFSASHLPSTTDMAMTSFSVQAGDSRQSLLMSSWYLPEIAVFSTAWQNVFLTFDSKVPYLYHFLLRSKGCSRINRMGGGEAPFPQDPPSIKK